MGNSSRRRRDQRRAQTRATRAPHGDADDDAQAVQQQIIGLIELAARFAVSAPRSAGPRIVHLNELGATAPVPQLDPAALVVDQCLSRIRVAWEHGWQPQDLVHAARRRTSAASARWIARAVLVEADRTDASTRAPRPWVEQLEALASRHDHAGGPDGLLPPRGRAAVQEWTAALVAMTFLNELPRSQILVPPPSQWGTEQRVSFAAPRSGGRHDKTLTKIRALLAKAESTEFAAEAEAFTAKAQDLMTRHSIDEALVADEQGGPVDVLGVRVLIHHPYAMEKASLLHVVAEANRTRAVWNDFASSATLVGVPTDVAQVEMLFTSTLVQATRAMTRAGEESHGVDRSSSFRKAFLIAYAHRIGERLTSSSDDAVATYGSDLVPVFQRQEEAISGEVERLFPRITSGSSRRRQLDLRGWEAGTRAADAAVLPAGAVES